MRDNLNLVVMLTHNDKTVMNAMDVFRQCKATKAKFWGMKEEPLPVSEMKAIYDYMKANGKVTVLETVAYTEEECLNGANVAVECGCDILMGTKFFDSVNELCKKYHIKYMPFVGEVIGRPSVLTGTIDEMIAEAKMCIEKGVYGIDLLAYRYQGDVSELCHRFLSEISVPVCIAGSVNSFKRLDALNELMPWGFTIGGAFFEGKFEGDFDEQVDRVCDYVDFAGGTHV